MFNIAYAETGSVVNAIFAKVVDPVINFLFILAFLYFIYGIVVFIQNANNEEARAKGKQHMVWGIVGLLIMFSAFTIMQIIVNTLDLESPPNGPNYRQIDQN